ncbi:MAG: hypothetical protein AB1796_14610 [Bacillota bacterium]
MGEEIAAARKGLAQIVVSPDLLRLAAELAARSNCQGHRAEQVMVETVRALAAFRGKGQVTLEDLWEAAETAGRESDYPRCQSGGCFYAVYCGSGDSRVTTMNVSFNGIAIPLNISRLYHRTYEEFMMAPLNSFSVVLGEAAAGCLRGFFAAVGVLALSFAFGARLNLVPLFWLILLINSFLFSCLGPPC